MIGSNHFEIDKTILAHLNEDSQRIALAKIDEIYNHYVKDNTKYFKLYGNQLLSSMAQHMIFGEKDKVDRYFSHGLEHMTKCYGQVKLDEKLVMDANLNPTLFDGYLFIHAYLVYAKNAYNLNLSNPDIYTIKPDAVEQLLRLFTSHCHLFFLHKDALNYFSANKSFKENLQAMGFSDALMVKYSRTFRDSELPASILLNHVERENTAPHRYLRMKSGLYDHIKRADHTIWLEQSKWINKTTVYKFKDVDIALHNHILYFTLMHNVKLSTKQDLKTHPKKVLENLLQHEKNQNILNSLLLDRYEMMHDDNPFDIPEDILKLETDEFKFLKTPRSLFEEGKMMDHCVGSPYYVMHAKSGLYLLAHYTKNGENIVADGITIHLAKMSRLQNKNGNTLYALKQQYGVKNKVMPLERQREVQSFLDKINSR